MAPTVRYAWMATMVMREVAHPTTVVPVLARSNDHQTSELHFM